MISKKDPFYNFFSDSLSSLEALHRCNMDIHHPLISRIVVITIQDHRTRYAEEN